MLMKGEQIRLIETNTQVRSLFALAEMLRHINGEIPMFILEEEMLNWSLKEEVLNSKYKTSQGKLTENGQKTKAFKHYIKLAEKLELIFLIGQTIQLTKFGEIFCLIFPEKSNKENLFFWYWLLKYDSDNLLTIWKILMTNQQGLKEIQIRQQYEKEFNERFFKKIQFGTSERNFDIESMIRGMQIDTKKDNSHTQKHLVPPRLAWLNELGIITSLKNMYLVTKFGEKLWYNLPDLAKDKDINEEWLNSHSIGIFFKDNISWALLSVENKTKILGRYLLEYYEKAYQAQDLSFRMNGYSALLFSAICINSHEKINANIYDLEQLLALPLYYQSTEFLYSPSSRHYETYISIRKINQL